MPSPTNASRLVQLSTDKSISPSSLSSASARMANQCLSLFWFSRSSSIDFCKRFCERSFEGPPSSKRMNSESLFQREKACPNSSGSIALKRTSSPFKIPFISYLSSASPAILRAGCPSIVCRIVCLRASDPDACGPRGKSLPSRRSVRRAGCIHADQATRAAHSIQ